ncbi:hypothetical protein HY493_05660 [Candidatus Woesearchaeota archaeon]|nr:hypothetical protein [Candidatus Woesearchaeota archaeon]
MPAKRTPDLVEQSVKNVKVTYVPRVHHIVLGFLMLLFLFWNDVVHNKVLDRGYDAKLEVVQGFHWTAGMLWYFTLIALFCVILIYMTHRVLTRRTVFFDVLAGSAAVLGLGIMYAMTLLMYYEVYVIPVFNVTISSIALYHFGGIAVQILVALYFTFTQ